MGVGGARYLERIILDSSAVEHSAVNRRVVGSNPTRGVFICIGVWSNGMTEVSKTFSEGSIPSTPVFFVFKLYLIDKIYKKQNQL